MFYFPGVKVIFIFISLALTTIESISTINSSKRTEASTQTSFHEESSKDCEDENWSSFSLLLSPGDDDAAKKDKITHPIESFVPNGNSDSSNNIANSSKIHLPLNPIRDFIPHSVKVNEKRCISAGESIKMSPQMQMIRLHKTFFFARVTKSSLSGKRKLGLNTKALHLNCYLPLFENNELMKIDDSKTKLEIFWKRIFPSEQHLEKKGFIWINQRYDKFFNELIAIQMDASSKAKYDEFFTSREKNKFFPNRKDYLQKHRVKSYQFKKSFWKRILRSENEKSLSLSFSSQQYNQFDYSNAKSCKKNIPSETLERQNHIFRFPFQEEDDDNGALNLFRNAVGLYPSVIVAKKRAFSKISLLCTKDIELEALMEKLLQSFDSFFSGLLMRNFIGELIFLTFVFGKFKCFKKIDFSILKKPQILASLEEIQNQKSKQENSDFDYLNLACNINYIHRHVLENVNRENYAFFLGQIDCLTERFLFETNGMTLSLMDLEVLPLILERNISLDLFQLLLPSAERYLKTISSRKEKNAFIQQLIYKKSQICNADINKELFPGFEFEIGSEIYLLILKRCEKIQILNFFEKYLCPYVENFKPGGFPSIDFAKQFSRLVRIWYRFAKMDSWVEMKSYLTFHSKLKSFGEFFGCLMDFLTSFQHRMDEFLAFNQERILNPSYENSFLAIANENIEFIKHSKILMMLQRFRNTSNATFGSNSTGFSEGKNIDEKILSKAILFSIADSNGLISGLKPAFSTAVSSSVELVQESSNNFPKDNVHKFSQKKSPELSAENKIYFEFFLSIQFLKDLYLFVDEYKFRFPEACRILHAILDDYLEEFQQIIEDSNAHLFGVTLKSFCEVFGKFGQLQPFEETMRHLLNNSGFTLLQIDAFFESLKAEKESKATKANSFGDNYCKKSLPVSTRTNLNHRTLGQISFSSESKISNVVVSIGRRFYSSLKRK